MIYVVCDGCKKHLEYVIGSKKTLSIPMFLPNGVFAGEKPKEFCHECLQYLFTELSKAYELLISEPEKYKKYDNI